MKLHASIHSLQSFFFPSVVALVFFCHLLSLNALPWMDEVHIVEMGRSLVENVHGTASILTTPTGEAFTPIYWMGPCSHELCFRLWGVHGVRILPMVFLIAATFLFRHWLLANQYFSRRTIDALALFILTQPLFVQSVRLVRTDMEVMALAFAVLCLIDVPALTHKRTRLMVAGFLMGISPFVWPTAILLFPLYAVRYWERLHGNTRSRGVQLLLDGRFIFCGLCLAALVSLLPFLPRIVPMLAAIGEYFTASKGQESHAPALISSVLSAFKDVAVLLTKESLRAPFLYAILPIGIGVAVVRKRLFVITSLIMVVLAVLSQLHTFRFIYLYPYLLILFLLGIQNLASKHPRVARWTLFCGCLYGLITGPLAYAIVHTQNASSAIQSRYFADVATHIEQPSPSILNTDYRTYYLGRTRGWRQCAYPIIQTLAHDPAHLLHSVDIILHAQLDPFAAIEESYTLYGILRNTALAAARREEKNPNPPWLARIGKNFAFNSCTLEVEQMLRTRYEQNNFSLAAMLKGPDHSTLSIYKHPSSHFISRTTVQERK